MGCTLQDRHNKEKFGELIDPLKIADDSGKPNRHSSLLAIPFL